MIVTEHNPDAREIVSMGSTTQALDTLDRVRTLAAAAMLRRADYQDVITNPLAVFTSGYRQIGAAE